MKRNLLFNKIISLSLIGVIYLVMPISAYADTADINQEETVSTELDASTPDDTSVETTSQEENPSNDVDSSEGNPTDSAITDEAGEDSDPAALEDEKTDDIDSSEDDIEDEDDLDDEDSDEENSEDLDEEDSEDEEEDEEEELEEECEHELIYTSNKDGSHTVSCALCEMEEYTASCVYDDDGICIYCGYKRLPDPVLVYEDEVVIVTVAGAIPENADLKVKPITAENEETKDLYADTASKMEELVADSEDELYGFVAYDICFVDIETGEEVEPSDNVTVSLEYKADLLPVSQEDIENAEKVTVDLVHINEKTNEVENLTEAGAATIQAAADTSVKSASFTNDSFSVYSIVWTGPPTKKITLELNNKFVDVVDGVEVPLYEEKSGEYQVTATTAEMLLKDQIDDVPGFKLKRAEVYVNKIHYELDGWKFSSSGYSSNRKYYIDFYKGTRKQVSVEMNGNTVTVDVIYEKNNNLTVAKIATGDALEDDETTYQFVIKDADGLPYGGIYYYVGDDLRTVDVVSGTFSLKSGEKAEFLDVTPGTYTISEIETGKNSNYILQDFTTKILEVVPNEMDTLLTEYESTVTGPRSIEVSVDNESKKHIKFKNCYTTISEPAETQMATVSKYIRYHPDDDNYDLTIKFLGPEQVITTTINTLEEINNQQNVKVDILLVVDKSTSMSYETEETDPNLDTRLECVIAAVDTMVETLKDKEDVDAKWKVIDFGKQAKLITGAWINTEDVEVTPTLGVDESIGGGTNYCAGLKMAKAQLATAREDAKKIIIFLTDGCPTYAINEDGTIGDGVYLTTRIENATYSYAESVECDYFYAVGMGLKYISYHNSSGGINAADLLANMCKRVKAEGESKAYNVRPEDVGQMFDKLAGTISSITSGGIETSKETLYSSNVVMTDTLSDYVDIVPNSTFKINVTKELADIQDENIASVPGVIRDGIQQTPATYTLPDGTVLTANYVVTKQPDETVVRTISMVFPKDYELAYGYEYQVKFYVQPSDLAYAYYFEHINEETKYPNVGDDETDHGNNKPQTSSGMPGFYSNGPSSTSYVINGESKSLDFRKPVVQVHFTNVWEIYKVNQDGEYLDGAEFNLVEQVEEGAQATTYTGTSQTVENANGLVVWNDTVATGKTYKLIEQAAPSGYVTSEDRWIVTISDENVPTVKIVIPGGDVEGTEYLVEPIRDGKVITYRFTFLNKKVYVLPNTGGNGIYKTTLVGIAMMVMAVFMYYMDRRKRRTVR